MPYGFPDSWVIWGGRKAGRKIFKPSAKPRMPPMRIGGRGSVKTKTVYKYHFTHMSWQKYALNYYREFHTNHGQLWKYLDRQGALATKAAKNRMRRLPQKPWRTGRLARSIHKKHLGYTNKTGQYVMVGSWTVPYALMVHRGTKPHVINPKGDNQLVFMGRGGGRSGGGMKLVRTNQVHHPGSRRNRYLYDQLKFFKGAGRTPMYTPNSGDRAKYKIK
jgi:hypothetical protein